MPANKSDRIPGLCTRSTPKSQSKVDELSRSDEDMQNLLNSIEIATIFLDSQLKITRWTEQAKRLVSLIQTDIGLSTGGPEVEFEL